MKSSAAGAGYERTVLPLILTLLGTLVTLAGFCALISLVPVEIPSRADIARIIFIFHDLVSPEPVERRMFMLSVATLPVVITGWCLLWKRILRTLSPEGVHRTFLWVAGGTLAGFIFYLLRIRIESEFFLHKITAGGVWYAGCCFIAAGLCYVLYCKDKRPQFWVTILTGSFSVGLLLLIFFYCLYDITNISDSFVFTIHFNVIFHAMVQVFLGKELLVDFVHQYGLYPHLLEPLFRLTGLDVLTFTIAIGVLTVLSFLFLLRTMFIVTTSRTVALLGFLALVSSGYISKIISSYDPYFQYVPLRTIFPALALWLVASYLTSRSMVRFVALYIVSSLAILWNPETGCVVMIAVLLTTLYDEYSRNNLRSGLLLLCKGVGISVIVITFCSCYLYLRYGAFPDYRELVRYAQLFYVTGFYMLPLAPLHPWNLVFLIYIAGLSWGIGALLNDAVTHRTSVVTFISLLGIGLFAYYQGRSHDEVLLLCIYPAFLLLTVFTDTLLVIGAEHRIFMIVGACGVVFLVFTAGGLYNGVKAIAYGELSLVRRYEEYRQINQTAVMQRADFIRERTVRGEEVLILSGHSGLFHLVSQTTNPIRTPSIPETVLVEDYQKILAYVDQGACRKLFIDMNQLAYNHPDYHLLRGVLSNRYIAYGFTPDWKLAMFVKVR